jgi:nucleotide-binding universal stress UspA family protein
MFDEVLACLDGSPLAQEVLPLAHGITVATSATLTIIRVVADADELAAEESELRQCARRYRAEVRFLLSADPAAAIVGELKAKPNSIAAMTTHGRTAWTEAILGSVALRVIQGSRRPVILYRAVSGDGEAPKRIKTLVMALDGSEFSERMIPFAAEMAQVLAGRLSLVQALSPQPSIPALVGNSKSDMLESSYLHGIAGKIKHEHGIDCEWEVLHGDPADALCRYVKGMPETMLAMTSHARGGLQRALLGGVAGACVRRAGVPILMHWPRP